MRAQLLRLILAFLAIHSVVAMDQAIGGFVETFSNPPSTEGWITRNNFHTNPGVGGNPDGFLRGGEDDEMPWAAPSSGASGGEMEGDIWAANGSVLNFTFDFTVLSPGTAIDGLELRWFKAGQFPESWRYQWTGLGLDNTDGWITLTAPMNQSWDDATAQANGWIKSGSPTSFSDILTDLGAFWDIHRLSGTGTITSSNAVGYDNIGWITIPEPNSIILWGLSGLLAIRFVISRRS